MLSKNKIGYHLLNFLTKRYRKVTERLQMAIRHSYFNQAGLLMKDLRSPVFSILTNFLDQIDSCYGHHYINFGHLFSFWLRIFAEKLHQISYYELELIFDAFLRFQYVEKARLLLKAARYERYCHYQSECKYLIKKTFINFDGYNRITAACSFGLTYLTLFKLEVMKS